MSLRVSYTDHWTELSTKDPSWLFLSYLGTCIEIYGENSARDKSEITCYIPLECVDLFVFKYEYGRS